MILIDPKQVEFVPFDGIPHLLAPVLSNINEISEVLEWLEDEMNERYTILKKSGSRNITQYLETAISEGLKPVPFILVIIDELADLLLTSSKTIETQIIRLAQKSRAVGIHLIISTQRPSVDIVTGIMKANFPSRIAFKVATHVDSKVILDDAGAEMLMGKGDMLFKSSESTELHRLHGCYITNKDVENIVECVKK